MLKSHLLSAESLSLLQRDYTVFKWGKIAFPGANYFKISPMEDFLHIINDYSDTQIPHYVDCKNDC